MSFWKGIEDTPDLVKAIWPNTSGDCGHRKSHFTCTRGIGHTGRHLAGTGGDIAAAWPGEHPPTVADLTDPAPATRHVVLPDGRPVLPVGEIRVPTRHGDFTLSREDDELAVAAPMQISPSLLSSGEVDELIEALQRHREVMP